MEETMGARRDPREDRWDLLGVVLVGVAYFVAAKLSLRLSLVGENITPLWPPTGIALVAFLLRGRRLWPGVALAAFAVNLPITETPLAAATTAVGNTLAPLLAATLLLRVGFHPEIDRMRDALAIVFLGALLSMTVSASIGAATLLVTGAIPRSEFLAAWSVWWAGDAMGILVVAPFLLTLSSLREPSFLFGREGVEALGFLALVGVVTAYVLSADQPLLFAVLPVIGLTAWRVQQRGAAPAALIVSILATWAAVEQRGPFAGLDIPGEMLTLQAFNASVAFTSFFFAASVSERLRARRALEEAASRLDERVRERTAELSAANDRLAEAQAIARLGFWEWDLRAGTVRWSDEMYRLYGVPLREPITFERAIELVVPEDRAQIQTNVARALEHRWKEIPEVEYGVVRDDGTTVTLRGRARAVVSDGEVVRMLGTVQDVSERRELAREHRIADTLQRALLPQSLPELPGVAFASRYVPGEVGSSAGGDWYDVIDLPDGTVAFVIGDVAGHGIEAASVMGQVRTAVRAYGLEGHGPRSVVGLVHDLLRSFYGGEQMVTMLYVVVDPLTLEARVVNAGHPPPIVLEPGEAGATFLESPTGLPLGLSWDLPYEESLARLRPGTTLVLYTDGLIDRRDVSVGEGLERLRAAAGELAHVGVDELCGALLDALVPPDASDDVAIVAAGFAGGRERFTLRVSADPAKLSAVRRSVARWLSAAHVDPRAAQDIVLACSEACANAIEHAYGPGEGIVEVEGTVSDGELTLVVRDEGRWRPAREAHRGRGLQVMEACMDQVEVDRDGEGTEVRMRRALTRGDAP
jgi:PAS domain S-box-containing protein